MIIISHIFRCSFCFVLWLDINFRIIGDGYFCLLYSFLLCFKFTFSFAFPDIDSSDKMNKVVAVLNCVSVARTLRPPYSQWPGVPMVNETW